MDRKTLTTKVIGIVARSLDVDRKRVTLDSRIVEDFNPDSLSACELIMTLEDKFNIEISDEEAESVITVGDIVDTLDKRLG